MNILQIAAFACAAAFLAGMVRREKPEIASLIAIAAGIAILDGVWGQLSKSMDILARFAETPGVEIGLIRVMLKALGISYAAEFAAQTCADAGEEGIAQKVTAAGRILIFMLALPTLVEMAEKLLSLLPASS